MSDKCIFIISSFKEPNVDAVISILEKRHIHWFRFNTETFPLVSRIQLRCDTSGDYFSTISVDNKYVDTREVTAVWNRRVGGFVLPEGLSEQDKGFVRSECVALVSSVYTSLTCPWVNPVYSEHMSGPKSYQLVVATELGISVPRTLVTNDPSAAIDFFDHNPKTLFKVVSGVSQITEPIFSQQLQTTYSDKFALSPEPANQRRSSRRTVFSRILTPERLEKVASIAGCPVVFQQYVEKSLELRITIVGNDIFAAEIHSQELEETKVDFRRMDFAPGHRTVPTHRVHILPSDIATKLLLLMKRLDLVFGCVDMILTPEGDYVFLEVNPSGQWNWIEVLTGMKITEALVDVLINPPLSD